jgi:ribosomal protein S18 acetylase RimI-like enzyme
MNYSLQPATREDLQVVLARIETEESLKLWSGPILSFPPHVENIWREIGATQDNTCSRLDPEMNVVEFGQALRRGPATVHLARIIVAPVLRGKGLGRILCQQSILVGLKDYQAAAATLNVYTTNAPALRLYESLGFTIVSEDCEHNWLSMRLLLKTEPTLDE